MTDSGAELSQQTLSFDNLIEACRRFDVKSTKPGAEGLATYIHQFSSAEQPTLLRNLLHGDVARRRQNGETPLSAEYVEVFPEHANLIRSVFLETTSVVISKSQLTKSHNSAVPQVSHALPAGDHLGNYQLLRQLGRGGMGLVFEAEHLQRKHRVALKTLPAVDGSTLLAFKQEFRRMAELNHPHVIGLHALEEDHGHWYFTMDLIDGTDFLSYVRPNSELDEARLRAVFPQLVSAILRLHGDNLIHRDLKPSNVMVDRNGKLVVLDFGLAYERKESNGASIDGIRGTLPYMAPEQTVDGSVTGAADWYAVGVMLHEAISGSRPFEDLTDFDLVFKKRDQDAPELRVDRSDLHDLIDLTNGFLKRDPDQRPDPLAIAKAVSQSVDLVATKPSESSGGLVGRETQLALLTQIRKSCIERNMPEMAFVSGRSGEGKTALVDCFIDGLRKTNADFVLLAGRCYDRESVPFKALDSLIDALAQYLSRLPEADAALLMPDEITFLANLFPVLKRVQTVAKLSDDLNRGLDQIQIRTRAFAGLRSLLKRISIRTPVIMFADDLQWGDADSAQALFDILKPTEAPNVFFIGSFRCEETDSSAFLVKWEQLIAENACIESTDVKVSALTIEQCVQLAINTIGEDSERLRTLALEFASQTGGNALLLTELLSCFDANAESFKAMPIKDVIDAKLARLPDEATKMLEAIAVSGRSIEFEELALAADAKQEASSVVTHMRSEKLVRLIGDEESSRVDTFHDKIRETVLLHMAAERRLSLHRSLAESILASADRFADGDSTEEAAGKSSSGESRDSDLPERFLAKRVFDLSYHFDGANDREKALKFSLLAAKQAASQFSQQVAADHFAVARRNVGEDPNLRFVIAEGEGRALTLLGKYPQALERLEGTVDLTEDTVSQARILGMFAEIYHKQGRIDDGMDFYARALRKLGYYVPGTAITVAVALGYETAVQLIHTFLPAWIYRRNKPLSPHQELSVELANKKSIVSYYSNVPRMVWAHLKGMNVAETRQSSNQLAYSYGLHPAPVSAVGLAKRGLRYSDLAVEHAKKASDLLTEGHCFTMRSMAFFSIGNHNDALEDARYSIECLTRAGDPYLAFIAACQLSYSAFRQGKVTEAIDVAFEAFDRSIRHGEQASLAPLLFGLTFAARGKFPYNDFRACYELEKGDNFSNGFTLIAEGLWHLHYQRLEDAIRALEDSWNRATRTMCLTPYLVEGLANLITTHRIYADKHRDEDRSKRRSHRKRARWLLWQLAFFSRLFPYLRPHYLREVGMFRLLNGKPEKALKCFYESMNVAEAGGDVLEHSLTSAECAKVEIQLGKPGGEDRLASAQQELDRMQSEADEQIAKIFG